MLDNLYTGSHDYAMLDVPENMICHSKSDIDPTSQTVTRTEAGEADRDALAMQASIDIGRGDAVQIAAM